MDVHAIVAGSTNQQKLTRNVNADVASTYNNDCTLHDCSIYLSWWCH